MPNLTTKELSTKTFPDFVGLFSQGGGWDHCGCVAYQGVRAPKTVRRWADKRDYCLAIKCDLVERGRAHGILVYQSGEPVGWCQFGPRGELPLDDRQSSKLFLKDEEHVWKITCFVCHQEHRGQGVARVALRGALGAIRKRGGGLVEAYPIVTIPDELQQSEQVARIRAWRKELMRLIKAHGSRSEQVRQHEAKRESVTVNIEGVGLVDATDRGTFHGGTVSLFEGEGFEAVSVMPSRGKLAPEPLSRPSRLVMQKVVREAGR